MIRKNPQKMSEILDKFIQQRVEEPTREEEEIIGAGLQQPQVPRERDIATVLAGLTGGLPAQGGPVFDINKKFYDIINQEDWDEISVEEDPTIRTDNIGIEVPGDFPIGQYIMPTPIPGVWISIALGLDIEDPGVLMPRGRKPSTLKQMTDTKVDGAYADLEAIPGDEFGGRLTQEDMIALEREG